LGLFFGISNNLAPQSRVVNVTIKFPNTCFLRDRDGDSNYAFYHHDCGWYHYVDGQDKIVYCCPGQGWQTSNLGNCDEFNVTGFYGGILKIANYVEAGGDNYDDIRIYIECPRGLAFGNTSDPLEVTVANADYFWVNNMNYTQEMKYSEPLPYSLEVESNTFKHDVKFTNCGKYRVGIEIWKPNIFYGSDWNNWVCVKGVECPHTTC
jgi:hypothetical protein